MYKIFFYKNKLVIFLWFVRLYKTTSFFLILQVFFEHILLSIVLFSFCFSKAGLCYVLCLSLHRPPHPSAKVWISSCSYYDFNFVFVSIFFWSNLQERLKMVLSLEDQEVKYLASFFVEQKVVSKTKSRQVLLFQRKGK